MDNFTCKAIAGSNFSFTATGHLVNVYRGDGVIEAAEDLASVVILDALVFSTQGVKSAQYDSVVLQGSVSAGNDMSVTTLSVLNGGIYTDKIKSATLELSSLPNGLTSKIVTVKGNEYKANCN